MNKTKTKTKAKMGLVLALSMIAGGANKGDPFCKSVLEDWNKLMRDIKTNKQTSYSEQVVSSKKWP